MHRSLRVLALALTLAGCGGSPSQQTGGFVNQTRHSTADLWTIWKTAQNRVARAVDLNPLQRRLYDAPAEILPGNRLALSAQPRQIVVAAKPDVSSEVLLAAAGIARNDPTGLIVCPQPCNVRYAAAYSRYRPPQVKYAASWEFQGDNFSLILEYEFESQILYQLGYDVKWR